MSSSSWFHSGGRSHLAPAFVCEVPFCEAELVDEAWGEMFGLALPFSLSVGRGGRASEAAAVAAEAAAAFASLWWPVICFPTCPAAAGGSGAFAGDQRSELLA